MLRIAPELELAPDVVTQAIAILARRGAGKTYTASVLAEEVIGARLPVVILDPTGAWWGLRSSADGLKAGLPVVIFGGEHGDVPLEAAAGRLIADVVVDHPGAYVIDLSGFESKKAEQRFVADFLERLYRAKATRKDPLLVIVDEADGFAPQRPGPEQTRTLGALEAIVRRGRIRGLGVVLVTQRAAVLNKNVLTQTEVLVVMQTTGPQDRAAIDDWISGNGTREERDQVLGSLASLEQGEAWVWSPSWLRQLVRIHVRTRRTFDSSKTPEAGQQRVEPRAFAKVDLEQLDARIRATAETAKANDPAELRRRIAELERFASTRVVPEPVVERVEVPILREEDVTALQDEVDQLVDVARSLTRVAMAIRDAMERAQPPVAEAPKVGRPVRAPEPVLEADAPWVEAPKLKAGARRMLSALASLHPVMLTRTQMATLADIAPTSGTFTDYLSAIRSAGLIVEVGQKLGLSAAGQGLVASELGRGAPSPSELVAMWGRKLKAGARRMLDVLRDVYPEGLTRTELGRAAEISPTSGTFTDYLSALRRLGLLDESNGDIRAGGALFLGAR